MATSKKTATTTTTTTTTKVSKGSKTAEDQLKGLQAELVKATATTKAAEEEATNLRPLVEENKRLKAFEEEATRLRPAVDEVMQLRAHLGQLREASTTAVNRAVELHRGAVDEIENLKVAVEVSQHDLAETKTRLINAEGEIGAKDLDLQGLRDAMAGARHLSWIGRFSTGDFALVTAESKEAAVKAISEMGIAVSSEDFGPSTPGDVLFHTLDMVPNGEGETLPAYVLVGQSTGFNERMTAFLTSLAQQGISASTTTTTTETEIGLGSLAPSEGPARVSAAALVPGISPTGMPLPLAAPATLATTAAPAAPAAHVTHASTATSVPTPQVVPNGAAPSPSLQARDAQ